MPKGICDPDTFIQQKLDRAIQLTNMMENYFGNGDVDGLADYYRENSSADFTYFEEYVGESLHPMNNRGPLIHKGYSKILEIASSFTLKMPDFIFKFTHINVEDNGNLISARWECNGSKQPDALSSSTMVTVYGYANFYLTDSGNMKKLHYIVHSNS